MAQTINTNVSALSTQRALSSSQGSLQTSMQRLSTGLRINSAKDDAAGQAIAERMNAQAKGMNVAQRNANDGISMLQTMDSALSKITDTMQRMRELAVQSSNGSNTASDRANLVTEFQSLQSEVARVVTSTKFNGKSVLTSGGTTDFPGGTADFQVGANNTVSDRITVNVADLSTTATGTGAAVAAAYDITPNPPTTKIGTDADAQLAIDQIDAALDSLTTIRAGYGAAQSRFDSVVSTLQSAAENQTTARGRIMDADFATESANLSRSQVLQQAGTAMLAQANQSSQNVMQLLRG